MRKKERVKVRKGRIHESVVSYNFETAKIIWRDGKGFSSLNAQTNPYMAGK